MLSRKTRSDIGKFLGRFYSKPEATRKFRKEAEERTQKILATFKNAELEAAIINFKNLAESERDMCQKQKLHSFYIALNNLQQLADQDLYHQSKKLAKKLHVNKCTLEEINQEIRSSNAFKIKTETYALLKDLKPGIENQQYNFNRISTYTHNCKDVLVENRTKNFFKAVASIAIAAFDMVAAPVFTLVAGTIASPILCTVAGSAAASADSKKVGAFGGAILGLLLSPIAYAAATIASPFIGAKLGIKTGKDWTGLGRKESIARCLLFQPKKTSKVIDKVNDAAKQLYASSDEHDGTNNNRPRDQMLHNYLTAKLT